LYPTSSLAKSANISGRGWKENVCIMSSRRSLLVWHTPCHSHDLTTRTRACWCTSLTTSPR